MSTRFSLSMEMSMLTGTGLPNPSRETKFSGANADREILFFLVQLTTCRIGNLTRLIHTLAICVTIHTQYVPDVLYLKCGDTVWYFFVMDSGYHRSLS